MNRRKVITPIILIVVLLCVFAAGTLVAKYISERNTEGVARAKEFYFTSNFLDGGTHNLAPGSESITFTLGNHADDLRFSEMDINYKVTVDNGATVENGTGTLTKDTKSDAEITISDLAEGKTYTVTAIGTGGYKKTLKATIVVPASDSQLYYHIDNSAGEYTLLTVWNEGDTGKEVSFAYAGIPDNTNPNMLTWKTGDSTKKATGNVTIDAHSSKVFRFFGETTITDVQGATEKKDIN